MHCRALLLSDFAVAQQSQSYRLGWLARGFLSLPLQSHRPPQEGESLATLPHHMAEALKACHSLLKMQSKSPMLQMQSICLMLGCQTQTCLKLAASTGWA